MKKKILLLILLMVALLVMPAMNRFAQAKATTCSNDQAGPPMACCAHGCCGNHSTTPGKCCIVRGNPLPDYVMSRWVAPAFDVLAVSPFSVPTSVDQPRSCFTAEPLSHIPLRQLAPEQGRGSRAPPEV